MIISQYKWILSYSSKYVVKNCAEQLFKRPFIEKERNENQIDNCESESESEIKTDEIKEYENLQNSTKS